ncbi:hypothetical protein BKA66DRAFT_522542 [Pyrenochaeta sp. MPI-SDFR-AT-0127]|nr:hypothetical protein BKA66DRAFT_522542 [Pyrenochaeta sp. MPI-SDFR-AT-0127]
MVVIGSRDAPSAQLSTTAIIAIVTGIGVLVLCLLLALIFLLVRAVRRHKELLADLDERGVSLAQAQEDARKESVTRPRTVLRRNTILPFNKSSGWGALPSVETFNSVESPTVPAYYAPPKPTEEVKKASRLSWPFSARRLSGHTIQMKKIKGSRLSTVIEDPQSSPSAPIMGNSHLNRSRPSLALSQEQGSQTSSSHSLLQYHPAFRVEKSDAGVGGRDNRTATVPSNQMNASKRLERAKSVAEMPGWQTARPQLRARSASLCGQTSGKVPDVILPPLPLDIARIKSDASKRSQLKRAPSKLSVSSFGSTDTLILANRASPVVPQPSKSRGQKITKPNAKGSSFAGGRPFRDTLDLRTRVVGPRNFNQSNLSDNHFLETRDFQVDNKGASSAESRTLSLGSVTRVQSFTRSRVTSPTASPATMRSYNTPKRRSKTLVTSSGSPERQCQSSTNARGLAGAVRSPKRQHSQTSSRSSGGNPFQWDPAPMCSTGKPSALKGSPSARAGHRRKNSVRISLVPTIHGPPSRTPSPSLLKANHEDSASGASTEFAKDGLGLDFSSTNSLPTPPSSSIFAPDLKFAATSIRASLTPTSPTLPLVNYDQSFVVFPTDQVLPALSTQEQKRLSNGSCFSLSQFPITPSIIEPAEIDESRPLSLPCSAPYEANGKWVPETPLLQQYPFQVETPERQRSPSPSSLINIDEYDPEKPSCIYQTPTNATSRVFQSAFATIPEESSVSSNKTVDPEHSRYDDSPPVSPKTISPPRFALNDSATYNLPIHNTSIPEERLDTIDPSVLSKDHFSILNSSFSHVDGNIFMNRNSNRSSMASPTTPRSAHSMYEPLLDAGLPPSFANFGNMDSPTLAHIVSESPYSSAGSSPSPTPSPAERPGTNLLCSPRPGHAQLPNPTLSINFADMPKLKPSPRGPRESPSRPLQSSIAALRRMNSDAADAKKERSGRGERRYLRLGREDSVRLPGDESWLDELTEDDTVELDEEEGRRLVGNVLEGWEDEGCTVLDLDEGNTLDSNATVKAGKEEINAPTIDVVEEDTAAGANQSISSIWEDGEKFWTSPTPPPPGSPNKPRNRFQSLASSPVSTSPTKSISSPTRKRHFEVAKDSSEPPSPTQVENNTHSRKRRDSNVDGNMRGAASGNRYRKRCVLGIGTPNVRIQVTSPNGHVIGGTGMIGTPGNLYDSQGFLRF